MKKRTAIIAVILVIAIMGSCGRKPQNNGDAPPVVSQSQEQAKEEIAEKSSDSEPGPSLDPLYSENNQINLLLNKYNEVNPTDAIGLDEFTPYYHHGSTHTDQASGFRNDYSITVSSFGSRIEVFLRGSGDNTRVEMVKAEVIKWMHALCPEASESELDSAWEEFIESDNPCPTITVKDGCDIEFLPESSFSKDRISYIKITSSKRL